MNRLLFAVVVTACGGASAPTTQAPIVRSEPDRAAIAPPPPVPEIPDVEETSDTGGRAAKKKPWAPPPSGLDFAEPTGAPANARIAGSVLVWVDATFYLAPTDDATTMKLATLPTRKERLAEAVPMRVRGVKGGFIEVDSPVADEYGNEVHDCAWFALRSQMDVGPWRLYVKRADLAPVVTKKIDKTFGDGSRLEIEPGMPVAPLADGRIAIGFKNVWVPVTLPSSSIGYAYPSPEKKKTNTAFKPQHQLDVDEVAIADTHAPLRTLLAPLAETVETKGDRVAFPLGDSCGRATVVVAATDVRPYTPAKESSMFGVGGLGMGTVLGAERWYLPRGTRLVAEGGQASTTVTFAITLPKPTPGEKQVCVERYPFITTRYLFGPKLDGAKDTKVRVCAPTRAVKYEKANPNKGGGAFGDFGKGTTGKKPDAK